MSSNNNNTSTHLKNNTDIVNSFDPSTSLALDVVVTPGQNKIAVEQWKQNELVNIFSSASEAAFYVEGSDKNHISACMNGKRKTNMGYTWKKV